MNKYLGLVVVVGSLMSSPSYSNSLDNKVALAVMGIPTAVFTSCYAIIFYCNLDQIGNKWGIRPIEKHVGDAIGSGLYTFIGTGALYFIYRYYQESEKHDRLMEERNRKHG